jgi:hypothetical protein
MITIDFSIFIEQEDIFDVFNLLKRTLKAFFTFNDFESMLNSDLINFKNTHFETNLTNKQIEFIEFKIENSENLFHLIYSKYEKLKNFSTEEKLKMSEETLFELLRKTNLSNIQILKLHNRFLNDYKEFLIYKNKTNEFNFENTQFLNEIDEFKSLFKDSKYTLITPQALSEHNLIYMYQNGKIEMKKENSKSDLIQFLVVLEVENITNKVNRKVWNNIMKKCINDTANRSFFSQKLSDYKDDGVTNVEDEERINNIKSLLFKTLK